jgi:steroid delta-isomerase-like uncharacterized protein
VEAATGAALDPAFVEDFAARYLEAWNSGDGAAVAAMCSEDVSWRDAALPEVAHGRDAVRQFVEATFRAFPDFHVEELAAPIVSDAEPLVLGPYRMTGTFTSAWEPLGMAPTGARFSVEGVDSWRFRDGMLHEYATYYDSIDMARQLGVLPPIGSGAERVMRRLQPLQARFQRRRAGMG